MTSADGAVPPITRLQRPDVRSMWQSEVLHWTPWVQAVSARAASPASPG